MPSNYDTTTKFKVDISELKSAMQEAKRQITLANSEFKAVSSSMDNWAKSTDGISAKLKQLDSTLNSQKTILSSLEKQYELTVAEMGEGSKEADNLKIAINNQKAAINKTEKEINNFNDSLEEIAEAEEIAARSGKTVDEVLEDLADEAKNTDKEVGKLSDGFTVMKGVLANLVAEGISKSISALKDFTKEAIQTGIDFEASMSEVSAISGATGDDLELLEKTAKEFGSTTTFSASEAAQALKYMALAGWDAKTASSALGGVLNLAAAAGMDLAQASDMVTDYLSAFGLEAKQSTYFADMLAYAQSNSNTSAEQLGEAYKNTAANMNAAGQDVETTTALLAMMANQGFKGAEAGTALTAMMRDLTAKMENGQIMIGKTAVTVMDANGNYRDMTDILKDVEAATQGMGDAERATALATTFTADSTKGLNLLLNAGIGEAEKFEEALRKSGGTAEEMGKTMNDNVAGDLKALESAMEGVKIEVYKELQPEIRKFIKYLTKDGVNAVKDMASKLIELGKKAAPLVKKAFEALTKVIGFVVDNFEALTTAVLLGVTAFKSLKAAMAIANTVTAFKTAVAASTTAVGAAQKAQLAWNAAMNANVIGAVISAVALLATGIGLLIASTNDATNSTNSFSTSQGNAASAANNASVAYELAKQKSAELSAAFADTIAKAQEEATAFKDTKEAADNLADAELANIDNAQKLWKELQTLADENGKVKEGYEGRAQFILNELNEALGTEYSMNDGIINQYSTMQTEMAKVIEAKKAQILLTAYEEAYRQAVENVSAAEKARAEQAQELAALEDTLLAKKNEVEQAKRAYMSETDERSLYMSKRTYQRLLEEQQNLEDNLNKKKDAYNESSGVVQDYYDTIDTYQIASTLVIEGKTSEAIGYLNRLGSGFQTAASTAKLSADEQKKVLEQQVIDTEVNLRILKAEYEQNAKDLTEAQKTEAENRIKNAQDEADAAKEEFIKVGGNLVKGMAEGAEGSKWSLTDAMSSIVDAAVKKAKEVAGIESPSKLFKKEVGKYLGLGIAAGIDDSTKDVVKSVKNQVADIKNAYGNVASQLGVNSITGGLTGGLNGGVINNFYQTNNSPKALSRLEIYRQSKNLLGYAGGGT